MTKLQQQIGKRGQDLAAAALRQLGIEMVEQIGTPVILIPADKRNRSFCVVWGEKVSGDHRGILPGGRSVLAETKTILDRNLRWSDLREHQPERLSEHARHGGLSLLVWVHRTGVHVMRWPVVGFAPGEGMSPEFAMAVASITRQDIEGMISDDQEKDLSE